MFRCSIIIVGLLLNTISFAQTSSFAESVEYDPIGNRFLASADQNSILQIDTSGNLSYFGNGLTADLGMEIIGNRLFCIVSTTVMVYDLTTELMITSINIPTAQFLNGMASDGVSTIWVSDFQGDAIYEIDVADINNPQAQRLIDTPNTPNGITYDEANNRLVFISWSDEKIRQIDLQDTTISVVLDNSGISNMDGIDMDGNNNFYVSSWTPSNRITKFSNDFSTNEIINVPGISRPADICLAKEVNILATPSRRHDVILWPIEGVTTATSEIIILDEEDVHFFPNPSKGLSYFKFPNIDWHKLDCEITDLSGRLIAKFRYQNTGNDSNLLNLSSLRNGTYIVSCLLDNKYEVSKQIILQK